jgi:zinc protease
MKHAAAAAAFALLLLAGCREGEKPSATTETSPGGIGYTRLHIPDAEDVSIEIAWPSDWAHREDVNQDVPHIGVDLILAGGAEGFPPGEVIETFADLNAEGSLWATADYLHGQLIAPVANLDEAIEIANAHLARPSLDPVWFDRVQQGLAANLAEANAQPATLGFEALRWAVLGDTPLRRALTGDLDAIGAATPDDVQRWHSEALTRTGAHIVIAGDIDAADAGAAVDALLAGLPDGAAPAAPPAAPQAVGDFSPRRILLHVPDAPTSILVFLGQLPPTRDGGEMEDMLLVTRLGGGDNSVLFDVTRTRLRATYAFGALIDAYARDLRFLMMGGEIETARLAEAETVVREAYAAFRAEVPVGDLARLKAPFAAQAERTAGDPVSASTASLLGLLDGHDPGLVLGGLTEVLDRVTDATLWARAASASPEADRMIVLAVSPDAAALPGACVIRDPSEAAACR